MLSTVGEGEGLPVGEGAVGAGELVFELSRAIDPVGFQRLLIVRIYGRKHTAVVWLLTRGQFIQNKPAALLFFPAQCRNQFNHRVDEHFHTVVSDDTIEFSPYLIDTLPNIDQQILTPFVQKDDGRAGVIWIFAGVNVLFLFQQADHLTHHLLGNVGALRQFVVCGAVLFNIRDDHHVTHLEVGIAQTAEFRLRVVIDVPFQLPEQPANSPLPDGPQLRKIKLFFSFFHD